MKGEVYMLIIYNYDLDNYLPWGPIYNLLCMECEIFDEMLKNVQECITGA